MEGTGGHTGPFIKVKDFPIGAAELTLLDLFSYFYVYTVQRLLQTKKAITMDFRIGALFVLEVGEKRLYNLGSKMTSALENNIFVKASSIW